jgi:uncharacterized protein (TIGR00251 family)
MGSMAGPVTRLQLRVAPRARRSAIVGRHGGGWKVRVAAAPEDGRANEALVELLSSTLDVPRAHVRLVSGTAARDKIVELAGVAPDEIDRRLDAAGRKEP